MRAQTWEHNKTDEGPAFNTANGNISFFMFYTTEGMRVGNTGSWYFVFGWNRAF
jgi:hypothetical protein